MKKLILSCFLALLFIPLYAADYYWVGGAGAWSDLNHWSNTSGRPANKSIIPGINDDLHFDANSGLGTGTVTLSTTGHSYCRNMSWVGVTTNAVFRNTGSYFLNIYGNLELSFAVRYSIQRMAFVGSGNATYKMNGASRINA